MFDNNENESFTVLENEAIGRNISMFRKVRGIKALDMAERLGMKEATYTKYERGETKITIDFLNSVSKELKVDPIQILTSSPGNYIDSGNNSPGAILGRVGGAYTYQTTNEQQTQMMMKLMESVMTMNEKVMKLLDERK
jgi:transcriptional regulator with XRE-family HTH domain